MTSTRPHLDRFHPDVGTVVITGGGRGPGLACARALGEAGCALVIPEPSHDTAQDSARTLRAMGCRAAAEVGGVTDAPALTAPPGAMARHGRSASLRSDIAGIAQAAAWADDLPDADWRRGQDVILNGPFWRAPACGRHMLAVACRATANLGSVSGTIANRPQNETACNLSKAAVHRLMRARAAERAGRGFSVTAGAPTSIETAMVEANPGNAARLPLWLAKTPSGRMGRPDAVAAVVPLPASPAASLMTGAIVAVDGGHTRW